MSRHQSAPSGFQPVSRQRPSTEEKSSPSSSTVEDYVARPISQDPFTNIGYIRPLLQQDTISRNRGLGNSKKSKCHTSGSSRRRGSNTCTNGSAHNDSAPGDISPACVTEPEYLPFLQADHSFHIEPLFNSAAHTWNPQFNTLGPYNRRGEAHDSPQYQTRSYPSSRTLSMGGSLDGSHTMSLGWPEDDFPYTVMGEVEDPSNEK